MDLVVIKLYYIIFTIFVGLYCSDPMKLGAMTQKDLAGTSTTLTEDDLPAQTLWNIMSTSGSPTLTLNISTNFEFSGTLGDSLHSLIKIGSGTLTLSGVNNMTGSTTISAGVIKISNESRLGFGNLILDGGCLQSATSFTFSRDIVLTANSTIDLSGFNLTFSGLIKTNGYSLTVTNSVTSNNTLTMTGILSGTGLIIPTTYGLVNSTAARNVIDRKSVV